MNEIKTEQTRGGGKTLEVEEKRSDVKRGK